MIKWDKGKVENEVTWLVDRLLLANQKDKETVTTGDVCEVLVIIALEALSKANNLLKGGM